jgi:hypothetical protein
MVLRAQAQPTTNSSVKTRASNEHGSHDKFFIILKNPFSWDTWNSYWLYSILLFIVTVISRLPFRSALLYDQDSVQFALGIRQYDVYLHQPHPPGYFLYVMAGRVINFFLQDANSSLLLLSIIGSGLTVFAVYHLGTVVFDRQTGLWAAGFGLTSPLLWYYGELALTYVFAACINTWIAILCWKLLQKQSKSCYLSPIVLGVAAGIRQDLALFLFPLWLFSIIHLRWKQVLTAGVILGITVAAWFIPMLIMTGGPARYFLAVGEYWLYHTSTFAIWNAGFRSRGYFFWAFLGNTSYGLGIGTIVIVFAFYAFSRTGYWRQVPTQKILFFGLWLFPAFLFHICVFMNPEQAGYSVFFLPALFVLLWPSLNFARAEIERILGQRILGAIAGSRIMALLLITANALGFLFSNSVVSAHGIRDHDRNLAVILKGIKTHFPASETVIIDDKFYGLYNYRQVQYYLPNYRAYLTALSSCEMNNRHILLGTEGQTFIVGRVDITPGIRYVVYLTNPLDHLYSDALAARGFQRFRLDKHNVLLYQAKNKTAAFNWQYLIRRLNCEPDASR